MTVVTKTQTPFDAALRLLPQPVYTETAPKMTQARLADWRRAPSLVSETFHEAACSDGFIYLDEMAYRCPVCEANKRLRRLNEQLEASGIEGQFLSTTWDDLELDLAPFQRLRTGAQRVELMFSRGVSLLFHGDHGGGKTQCAVLFARAAIEAGRSARVINLGELAADVRDGYSSQGDKLSEGAAVALLTEPDLLILEDLGAGETKNRATEVMLAYRALNKRHNFRKPCIVTTNLSWPEMSEYYGVRVLNRLQPLQNIPFTHGKNFRAPADPASLLWF